MYAFKREVVMENDAAYYTETEVLNMELAMELLKEYLYGWDTAIGENSEGEKMYRKKYVNMFRNR